jgi:uncharacterized membrane protein
MTTSVSVLGAESRPEDVGFRVPPGYERAVRFGAYWTMIISPYMILYLILVILTGLQNDPGGTAAILEIAGNSPVAFIATAILDGLFHALFFVTVIALFMILREAFPVQASLILVCGAWQMLMGFTKGMISSFVFPSLGSAYLAADPALQAGFIPVASAFDGLHSALQWMDSLGLMLIWILVSLLPRSTNLPRPVRWLGWIMAVAILAPDPAFLLVVFLSPFWLFLLGRWMLRLTDPKGRIP